jgi:hypothetical protein
VKVVKMNDKRIAFVGAARNLFGESYMTITRPEIHAILEENEGMTFPQWVVGQQFRTKTRGMYHLPLENGRFDLIDPVVDNAASVDAGEHNYQQSAVAMAPRAIEVLEEQESYVPEKFEGYVTWGNYNTVRDVIKSGIFYPIFITGMSGNGKTLMVKEVAARTKREFVRANITIETDEDDLIGGFRLLNGETVWHDGPVVMAMKRGAILLLDEIDLASNKIMCLQPILEGSSIYIKKIGKWVHPTPGFNVIATANTKGQGSDDGRFIGTNVMNESFLERFPVTIDQQYPTNKIEKKILINELAKNDKVDGSFVENLIKWADVIRKTFADGGVDEIISTRRLVHIIGAYSIFDSKMKAIEMCVARFDTETKDSFLDLYTKVDAGASIDELMSAPDNSDEEDEEEEVSF